MIAAEMGDALTTAEVQEMSPNAEVVLSKDLQIDGNTVYHKGKPKKNNMIVLLMFPDQDVGHFVCLWYRKGWCYFDPVGYKMGHYNTLKQLHNVRSNRIKFQADYVVSATGAGVDVEHMNTCGRHCAVRMRYPNLTDLQYAAKLIELGNGSRNYDRTVTIRT